VVAVRAFRRQRDRRLPCLACCRWFDCLRAGNTELFWRGHEAYVCAPGHPAERDYCASYGVDSIEKAPPRAAFFEPTFRSLIEGLLQVDPSRRMAVSDALAHPWMTAGRVASYADAAAHLTGARSRLVVPTATLDGSGAAVSAVGIDAAVVAAATTHAHGLFESFLPRVFPATLASAPPWGTATATATPSAIATGAAAAAGAAAATAADAAAAAPVAIADGASAAVSAGAAAAAAAGATGGSGTCSAVDADGDEAMRVRAARMLASLPPLSALRGAPSHRAPMSLAGMPPASALRGAPAYRGAPGMLAANVVRMPRELGVQAVPRELAPTEAAHSGAFTGEKAPPTEPLVHMPASTTDARTSPLPASRPSMPRTDGVTATSVTISGIPAARPEVARAPRMLQQLRDATVLPLLPAARVDASKAVGLAAGSATIGSAIALPPLTRAAPAPQHPYWLYARPPTAATGGASPADATGTDAITAAAAAAALVRCVRTALSSAGAVVTQVYGCGDVASGGAPPSEVCLFGVVPVPAPGAFPIPLHVRLYAVPGSMEGTLLPSRTPASPGVSRAPSGDAAAATAPLPPATDLRPHAPGVSIVAPSSIIPAGASAVIDVVPALLLCDTELRDDAPASASLAAFQRFFVALWQALEAAGAIPADGGAAAADA